MDANAETIAAIYADILNQEIKIKGMDRSFLDTIGAFEYGESHFTRSGYAKWFNRGALNKRSNRDTVLKFNRSPDADRILKSSANADLDKSSHLILEHVVPCAYIVKYLKELPKPITGLNVLSVHSQMYRRCIITKDEDKHLNNKGYNRTMPCGWKVGGNPYERYVKAGFSWAKDFT